MKKKNIYIKNNNKILLNKTSLSASLVLPPSSSLLWPPYPEFIWVFFLPHQPREGADCWRASPTGRSTPETTPRLSRSGSVPVLNVYLLVNLIIFILYLLLLFVLFFLLLMSLISDWWYSSVFLILGFTGQFAFSSFTLDRGESECFFKHWNLLMYFSFSFLCLSSLAWSCSIFFFSLFLSFLLVFFHSTCCL